MSGTELGWVLATLPLVSIVVQPFWGHVADRTGARSRIVVLLSIGSALGYLALAAAGGFWAILFATAAMAVFGTAVLPITVSVSLAILRDCWTACLRLRARLGHRRIFRLDCELSLDSGNAIRQLEGSHRPKAEPPSRDWGLCSLSPPCSPR